MIEVKFIFECPISFNSPDVGSALREASGLPVLVLEVLSLEEDRSSELEFGAACHWDTTTRSLDNLSMGEELRIPAEAKKDTQVRISVKASQEVRVGDGQ